MRVESLFPGLKIPVLARRKQSSLEGSFDHAYKVFDALPTTCPHIGDRDFSCGQAKLALPGSISGLFGINGNGPEKREVFIVAHQSNDELERQALILVEVEGRRVVFRVEGTSRLEEKIEDIDGEKVNGKVVVNDRKVFLQVGAETEVPIEVVSGSPEFKAFGDLLGLARQISKESLGLLCNACAAQKYGLPRSVVG